MMIKFSFICRIKNEIAGIPTIGMITSPSPIPDVAYKGIDLFLERYGFKPNTLVAHPSHQMLLEIFVGGEPYKLKIIPEETFGRNEFALTFFKDDDLLEEEDGLEEPYLYGENLICC
jgi:hypothetical protein